MSVTRSIDVMLSKDGIYVLQMPIGLMLCEVDDGKAYQLRLDTHERDGELLPGRWVLAGVGAIIGPFARHPTKESV